MEEPSLNHSILADAHCSQNKPKISFFLKTKLEHNNENFESWKLYRQHSEEKKFQVVEQQ